MLFCCCDPCPECTGSTCCGGDYPRSVGFCCEDVWRMPGDGTCCDGVWYATATPGECCGGVWHTDADAGDCCDGVWHPVPEGQTAPDLSVFPFQPVAWEAEECPEGTIYARWGQYGQCCGCMVGQVFDPRAGEHEPGYPPPGAYVPTASVIADLCCDICETTPYLPFDAGGNEIGCLGTCCASSYGSPPRPEWDFPGTSGWPEFPTHCSQLRESECAAGVHPTHPNEFYYSWTPSQILDGKPCCTDNPCARVCCVNGDLVHAATFEVTGEVVDGNEWTLALMAVPSQTAWFGPITTTVTYTAADGQTLDDIAAGLLQALAASTGSLIYDGTTNGPTITVVGPMVGSTITPPGGSPQPPTSFETLRMSPQACYARWGQLVSYSTPLGDECPCKVGPCCETATSSDKLLTFNKPATFSGTVRVTVTGTTTGPILVYDTPFGETATPSKQCPFTHTFLLCQGTFNISPLPCGGTFHRVDVEVCYTEETTSTEVFNFKGCNGPVVLGACPTECATTLLYTGTGLTSSAAISFLRDAVIEANGTGPLVLTGNITPVASCVETLTLTGTSTAANEIAGVIGIFGNKPSVHKTGTGVWRIMRNCTYYGPLRVLEGTLIVNSVRAGGSSPFGGDNNIRPIIGDESATDGMAALLVEAGTIQRSFSVASGGGSQVVVLGGYGAGLSRFNRVGVGIRLGRDVTLQASTGGTVTFANNWLDLSGNIDAATFGFVIGSDGNAGTVVLENFLPSPAAKVEIRHGTLRLDFDDAYGGTIGRATPVTIGDTGTSVTVIINGIDQPLSDLTLQGSGSDITGPSGGILRLVDSPTVTVSGTGHEISAAVTLDDDATFDGTGSLLISGVVSGSAGVTMDGSGTVTLSGANTYTGTTTINSGTMKAGSLTAFGTGGITVEAGGTLDKNGYAITNTITNNGGTVLN